MKYLYILKVGETFPQTKQKYNDFDSWISRFLKKSKNRIKTINILKNEKLPNLKSATGFIITGSHSMVTHELPWSIQLEQYIKKISKRDIPLLGICYGHQLIAKALGGKSDFNKNGKEIGVVKINTLQKHNHDPILKALPKKFYAYETHYQTVVKLPYNAKRLAKNKKENHQIVRFKTNIWGVQFHPEFDINIMKEYILNQEDDLKKLGFNIDKLLNGLSSCDVSSKILKNFEKITQNSLK
ncbi:glutamine amidotransferase [Sulfurimonas marina]|uniref:Glutamine amidotransferase n=1 Tax=Sulfurimonas marina TaxID=2590551 RepID=A0A7M1AW97_9BACT|nr:glutamine amidotransferase [Sulfurimonas marina]QOP41700.1 glutamine amidotransferase [Sulfurimonas marina]